MTNPSKQRGTAAETAVVNWLNAHGHPYVERRAGNGTKDRGDLSGLPGVVVEVKACRRDQLPGWVDEAEAEAVNAGVPVAAVIHKRAGKGDPGRWFVTMSLATWAELIK